MSFEHHGERQPMGDELRKMFADQQAQLLKRFDEERAGTAKREFPAGRVSSDDDGSLTFKIGSIPEKELIVIEYSTPTAWVGMGPAQAIELAQALIQHARAVSKKPVSVVLH